MSDARLAFLLAIAAFLARYTLYLGTTIFGTDSAQFLLMAQWMGEARFHDALAITYHPFYPFLAAVLNVFVGDLERSGFWVSMVLGSAAAVPLFLLVRSIFGRTPAIVTALFYAVQPHTVEVHADVMTEGTFAFFFFSSMWLCWRSIEEPSLERSIVAGLAACAAYLTRAEGILAVALVTFWPAAVALGRREGRFRRLAGVGVGIAAILILAFPFLVWVKSQMGTWKLSAKVSVNEAGRSFESAQPRDEDIGAKQGKSVWSGRYMKFVQSMGRLTYFVTVPFLILGFWGLRGHGWRGTLFYFSFPLLYLAGLLWSLRGVPYMSYRYLIPSMNLLMVMAGLGVGVLLRRWPDPRRTRWALAAVGAAVFVMLVPSLRPHRHEESGYREAGRWLAAHKAPGAQFYTTTDKLNFLAGGGIRGFPPGLAAFRKEVEKSPAAYYVIVEKDMKEVRPFVEWLRSSGKVGEPVTIAAGSPGVWSVSAYPAR